MEEALTFDDVLLVPQRSKVDSRKDIDLSIVLTNDIVLSLPIISSPMDTVTEADMAITLARLGGLGIIHRFCSIEYQANEILKVKRAENYLIENPICVSPDSSLKEIKEKAREYHFQTFLVVDENKKLLGLISKRDYVLEDDDNKLAKEIMTPFEKLTVSYEKLTFNEAKEIFKKYKIEKIPIVDKGRKVLGLITFRDFKYSLNKKASRDKKGRLLVGAAIGIRGDYLERAEELVKVGVDVLCIDVAHGHLEKCLKVVSEVKRKFPDVPLIAGNIATKEGAKDLKEAGADIIKVGIGPGSACTTRIVAGVGVPQITAIMEARKGAGETPIIADGGCRNSGDIVKALAAGANAVMLGSLLAGTDEAPGKIFNLNGKRVKLFRGMASAEAYRSKIERTKESNDYEPAAEGVSYGFVDYKGSVNEILINLEKGIRSGFSYCGALNIQELWQKAKFVKVTEKGFKEGLPHSIDYWI
ncbi:MAG: inosine-5'-monophosphate dehydrogenase [Candidatus Parcubacteria bacterium]|nr:MAG: inosine-5'-monophosphate dehydrogenase [Candidatus Parcubacteria bacterium]